MARIKEEDLRLRLVVEGGSAVRKAMADLKDNITDVENSLKSLTRQRNAAVKAEGEEASSVKTLNARIQEEQNKLQGLTDKYKGYERQLKLNNMTLSELRKHLKNTQAALAKAVPGTKNWKDLSAEVNRTRQRLSELRRSASATEKAMTGLTKVAGMATAAIAVIRGVSRAVSGAVNTIKDFEQANANLSTILGKNVNDIKGLTESALELGRTTEYTASQVTQLQTELAKLGFSEPQIQAMQEPVLHFATAVGADLPEAAALAGATLRIFGLNASQTEDTLATLAIATNKSALDFSFLQNAMSTVGPVANAFGFSVKDTTTLLGALANAGFDASSAATATRNILLKLADSNGTLAKALGGPVKTFPELMDGLARLNAKGVDLNTTLELTDKRSVAAFNAFLSGVDSANELHDALEDTDGALKAIADERMNTLEGSIKLLKSAWEGLILSFRNSSGTIKRVTDALRNMIEAITPGSKERKKMEAAYQESETIVKKYYENVEYLGESGAKERLANSLAAAEAEVRDISARQFAPSSWKEYKKLEADMAAAELRVNALRAALDKIETNEAADEESVQTITGGTSPGGGDDDGKKKTKTQWSLQNDEAYLKAKAELTKKYNEGEIASKEEYEDKLYQLEVASLTARLSTGKEKGAERAKIEEQLQSTIYKHKVSAAEAEKKLQEEVRALLDSLETDKTKIALAAEDERYRKEVEKWNKAKLSQEEHNKVMEGLETKHQQNLLSIATSDANRQLQLIRQRMQRERLAIANSHNDDVLSKRPGSGGQKAEEGYYKREQLESDLKYLKLLQESLSTIISSDNFQLMSPEDRESFLSQMESVKESIRETMKEIAGEDSGFFSAGGGGSLFGVSQDAWEQFFTRLSDSKLQAKDLQTILSGLGGAAQEGLSIASKAIELTNAKEKAEYDSWKSDNDKKKSELQKRLDNGLLSQEEYDRQIAAMEKEEAKREADVNLAQAKRSKTLAIIESIINTSLAVTKSLAQYAWPFNLIPAGIVGAMGTAQTAMIAAKPVGYAGGGRHRVERAQDGRSFSASYEPGKRGYVSSPTILVGEEGGEYIIPAEGLANPSLAPILQTIEAARKNGTLRNLNMSAVYPAYASGGYTSPGQQAASQQVVVQDNSEILSAINKLIDRFDNGRIRADVSLLGPTGFYEQDKKYRNSKNIGEV